MNWQAAKSKLEDALNRPNFGLITDLDGVLSPIVDRPDSARVTPRNLELLARLRDQIPLVAVLSGRSAFDAARRVDLPGLVYVGNHGMERWLDGEVRIAPEAAAYREALAGALTQIEKHFVEGMLLEDKGATISVHYRQTAAPGKVAAALEPAMQAIAEAQGLHLTQGRMVFEFRPPVQMDKGTAFEALVREHDLAGAITLGDDTTDVAVFRTARRYRENGRCLAYGLGVGSAGTPEIVLTEADFLVQEVAGVESFLEWLVKARMASST